MLISMNKKKMKTNVEKLVTTELVQSFRGQALDISEIYQCADMLKINLSDPYCTICNA